MVAELFCPLVACFVYCLFARYHSKDVVLSFFCIMVALLCMFFYFHLNAYYYGHLAVGYFIIGLLRLVSPDLTW